MARRTNSTKRDIESYPHFGKDCPNNPPVGLVTPDTDPETTANTYAHDPHIDPQLTWAGKAEHTSFEVPTVSLHVHERIDPSGTVSLPFEPGSHRRIAVKILDDRGVESLKIVELV